jgi:hypothetical protein
MKAEGKYLQVRGTEPRHTNTTIDGVNLPSPEPRVRQIKFDAIPADIVESVQISKTLQANMDGDGIGGSVNLVTKTATDLPTVSLGAMGGYTPIIHGRGLTENTGTIGKRFGKGKRLGVLIGGSYDWNGRGIDDIEPVPDVATLPNGDGEWERRHGYWRIPVFPVALELGRQLRLQNCEGLGYLLPGALFRFPQFRRPLGLHIHGQYAGNAIAKSRQCGLLDRQLTHHNDKLHGAADIQRTALQSEHWNRRHGARRQLRFRHDMVFGGVISVALVLWQLSLLDSGLPIYSKFERMPI